MRRFVIITISVFVFFLIEFLLFNAVGEWLKPDLLLLLVIFFNLLLGVRYSVLAAVVGGLIRDSFGIQIFGLNICTYMACAYLATYIRKNHYQVGSRGARVLLTFYVSIFSVLIRLLLNITFGIAATQGVFFHVIFPEVILTVLIADFIYQNLRKCALRLSV